MQTETLRTRMQKGECGERGTPHALTTASRRDVRSSKWVRSIVGPSDMSVNKEMAGKQCIEVKPTDKIAYISEILCIGCGICVKKYVDSWVMYESPTEFVPQMPIRCYTNHQLAD